MFPVLKRPAQHLETNGFLNKTIDISRRMASPALHQTGLASGPVLNTLEERNCSAELIVSIVIHIIICIHMDIHMDIWKPETESQKFYLIARATKNYLAGAHEFPSQG